MSKIEEIASVHLGKAGDGSVVKPYITPDSVDPSLLVGIPRELNRTAYEIEEDDLPFVGIDTWNCYEFSALTNNGFPVCGVLRIIYPADSTNIVESKSLKLYLNSFNMMRCGNSVEDVVDFVCTKVYDDLVDVLDADSLEVYLLTENDMTLPAIPGGDVERLEDYLPVTEISFDHYNEDPDILEVIDSTEEAHIYRTSVLRSNCRVTNQPDWGDVFIAISGPKTVSDESLLQYIVSMRKENHFHEEICECIYKRLYDLLEADEIFVACLYTRRGGIDINPARASSDETMWRYGRHLMTAYYLNEKTLRQ
jgi:7-cyano-7-deazaguanine reductase